MRRLPLLAGAGLTMLAIACEAPQDAPKPPASAAALPLPATKPGSAAREPKPARFAGTEHTQDYLLAELAQAQPRSLQPVGRTATVLRMRMGAVDAAFKAKSDERPRGPSAEIAAYRLARCLKLDNVPPAISRTLLAPKIESLLVPTAKERWPELRARYGASADGPVHGVAIYWIPELIDIGVDKQTGLQKAGAWLAGDGKLGDGELGDAQRSLAASLSNMLAFDYLIGNFDRWSGDNVAGNAAATFVYMRDHDLAFPPGLPETLHRRLLDDLRRAERFSRGFYIQLQKLSRASFEAELLRDPGAAREPLLSERQLQGVFGRLQTLLAHIDALIAERGHAKVLVFP